MILKNNVDRKSFLLTSKTWPNWLEVPELNMRVKRYDLPDGSYMLEIAYRHGKQEEKLGIGEFSFGTIYLVEPDDVFRNHQRSTTELIEYLKKFKEV